MGWDRKRNQRTYYYRSRRVGEQVVKDYVGRGPRAEAQARQDAQKRLRKLTDRHQWDQMLSQLERLRQPLLMLESQVKLLMQAILLLTGHYCHRGHEWRRRGRPSSD